MIKRVAWTFAFVIILGTVPAYAAPQRIVSLKPNITEIVFALGLGHRVVGVTKYCNFPKEARGLPLVADYTRPFIERIIALNPDIILASKENASRRPIERLTAMGYRVELFSFSTLDETIESIHGISQALGVEERGKGLAQGINKKFDSLKRQTKARPTKRVAIVVGLRPLIAAGPGSYMDELLGIIGTKNAVGPLRVRYPRIDLEGLISLNPDAIVDVSMGSEAGKRHGARPWDGIDAIQAVRDGRVIPFDMDALRPGPRLPEALARLSEKIHSPGTK
jgi:iron complex transport system substrate-binding protein